MANDKGYNGWSNYETWNVKLWMDNDEGSYRYWLDAAEEIIARTQDKDDAIRETADLLIAEIKDNAPELSGTYGDLLGAALSEVDWYEIAESLVTDILADHPELIESESRLASAERLLCASRASDVVIGAAT